MFRFYKLYSIYMNHSDTFPTQEWCVCEKLPRAVLHIPVNHQNICEVCKLSRAPRSLDSGSSEEEKKKRNKRQEVLLKHRRDEEAAESKKGARFKVGVRGRRLHAMASCKRGSGKSDAMARTAGGGIGEGDGYPEAKGKLSPKFIKMGRRHVDCQQELWAPPSSSPSPSPPPAPFGSPREEMHPNFGHKRSIYDNQAVKKITPLKGPITDPSGGAISKVYGNIWGASKSHISPPQAPLSSTQDKQKMQGDGLSPPKSKPQYTDSQLASQFCPFDYYDGPSEDALVVDEARRMLSRPNSLYMEPRPDLRNNRIGNYGSSLGGTWVPPCTMTSDPAPKPTSGPSTDKSPESEETKDDTKELTNSSSSSSIQADDGEEPDQSGEDAAKPNVTSKYDEILENLGLMKLSNEKEGTSADELANDNVVSSNKTQNDEEYSQVFSSEKKSASKESIRIGGFLTNRSEEKECRQCNKRKENVRNLKERERSEVLSKEHSAGKNNSIRIGGSLLKRSEEKVITVKKSNLDTKPSTSKSNKSELNVGNHKERDPRERSKVLSKEHSAECKESIIRGGSFPKRSEEKMTTGSKSKSSTSNSNIYERHIRNLKERDHMVRSEVLLRKHNADSKESTIRGGSLLKRRVDTMITVKKSKLDTKSSTSNSNKCELNVSNHKERYPRERSEVLWRNHIPDKKNSIITGGSLLKRSEENISTSYLGSKSSTSNCIKYERNVINHKEEEESEDPRKLDISVSDKLGYASSQEQVRPAQRKKCLLDDRPVMCNPTFRQSIAPTKPLPKRQVGVPPVTRMQVKSAYRVPPVTRKQKPEIKKLVTGNIITHLCSVKPQRASFVRQLTGSISESYVQNQAPMSTSFVRQLSGSLSKSYVQNQAPMSTPFVRQLAGSLSKSYVQNQVPMSFFEFRVPDIDLSDLEDSCLDSSRKVEGNAKRPETLVRNVRLTRNIKTLEVVYHRSGNLPKPKMAAFVKQLMGNLSESYVQKQPANPLLNLSEVPRELKDSCRDASQEVEDNYSRRKTPIPKGPVSLIVKMKTIGRLENKMIRESTSKCTTCGNHVRNHNESDPRKRSKDRDYPELKCTSRKRRVCLVNSGASLSRRCRHRPMEMEIKEYRWEDFLVLARESMERLQDTGNIESFETVYCCCQEMPLPQTASFVRDLSGNLSESYVRKQASLSIFEFRVPDVDPSELQYPCRDDSHEDNASSPESSIFPQTKKKPRAVWPDWSRMKPSEVFVSQKRSLIQKEEVVTRIIYDQNSSQSDSLEEKPAGQKKKKSRLRLMEETKWKRYNQVEELEMKHSKMSRILASEPEFNFETGQDSVSKEITPDNKLEVGELGDNTRNERYPYAYDSKEMHVSKQNPDEFSINSGSSLEPKITYRTTVYPGLPTLNWQVISLEKVKQRLSSGEGKECKCPIYKCKYSLTPKTLATHFQRDHRNKSAETYQRVVEGLPTQFSFNCENMTYGNNLVALLLYSSIRKETPRRSSPIRDYPLALMAAPERFKNGLPTGIIFWLAGYPTAAKLLTKLSVSKPLEFKGTTRIIQPRDISRRQHPQRFCPDSRDHLSLELPCTKQGNLQLCVVLEEDVTNFRA